MNDMVMERIYSIFSFFISAIIFVSCGSKQDASVVNVESADSSTVDTADVISQSSAPYLSVSGGEGVTRVEPLCWWTGMNFPLQLLVQGNGIGAYNVSVRGHRGVKIKDVHKADSPNYLFIDISIAENTSPGTFELVFKKGKSTITYPYELHKRAKGSCDREGFTTADMIYLIMPDRFANGDPSNDTDTTGVAIEACNRNDSFGRHGGDIQGIIDHLDYISRLGATAIWCTPLTFDNEEQASFHGYSCADYYHIDPRYGTNDLFRQYVDSCHAHGIKVISDFVPNHCGTSHWWMKDLPFEDWIHQFPEYTHTNTCFSTPMDPNASQKDLFYQVSGWFYTKMADLNLDNSFVLHYFQQLAIWWIEWSGIDGIRIDTYPFSEKMPSSNLCKAVMDEYPNFNIVGECATLSVPQLAYWQGGNVNADGFDSHLPSIMDFPLREAIIRAMREDIPLWDNGMNRVYDALSHDFAYHDLSHLMIFAANHDTERLGDVVGGNVGKMKNVTALLATIRGIPQTYYGDELMFRATNDMGDSAWRREFPGGWKGDKTDLFEAEGRNEIQNELYEYNCRLWQWRKTSRAVQEGKTLHFLTRDNTYAYFRYIDSAKDDSHQRKKGKGYSLITDAVFVYINNTSEEKRIPWDYYDEITPRLAAASTSLSTASSFTANISAARATSSAIAATEVTGIDVSTGHSITLSSATIVPAHSALVVDLSRPSN